MLIVTLRLENKAIILYAHKLREFFSFGETITNVVHVKELLYNYYQVVYLLCHTQSQQSLKH